MFRKSTHILPERQRKSFGKRPAASKPGPGCFVEVRLYDMYNIYDIQKPDIRNMSKARKEVGIINSFFAHKIQLNFQE